MSTAARWRSARCFPAFEFMSKTNTILLGVAKEIINPPRKALLIGYPKARPNTGIGADIYVRTVVFGNSGKKPAAVLAVVDMLQVPAAVVAAIRKAAAKKIPGLNPKSIMLAATHTHSAPVACHFHADVAEHKITGMNVPYLRLLERAVVKSIETAWRQKRRVIVSGGAAQAHLGHNRRVVVHGYAHNEWQDPKGRHTGYFNPDVNFLCFHDAGTKKLHAIISAYGCHPVTLGYENFKVNPDYPGYLVKALEKTTGAEMAMHVTSGAGNINPRVCLQATPKVAEATGKKLARAVTAALGKVRPLEVGAVSSRTVPVKFRLRANLVPKLRAVAAERQAGGFLSTEVQAIRLGGLAFVSAPGELFAEIATRVRKESPVKSTVVVEHANDAISYIFTDEAALQGAYEVCRGSLSESMEPGYVAAALRALGKK